MTTDITELAQSEINDALAQLKQISEYPTPSTQYARVLRKYILALVEALEKAQRANAAQDDHINQQQDRIESLEKKNAELGKYAGGLESFRTAYMEWSDKTDWVQTDKRFDFLKPWGKHRADVLKAYIEHLESHTVTVKLPHRNLGHDKLFLLCPFPYYDAEDMEKALADAGIKVEAE
ncbi:hypothetical protein DMP39_13950 [Klebsiella pneumoniae]|uniref:hypothetical protein n=1 Tax=Klebsiella pneumoniae TaxID=573 RepID=UPI000B529A4C|nr:hypothetical protein [Klebsiella pneumoniae]PXG42443.1 hypothetical protein DMP39_13950 [Klebsiella pneumoniae]